MSTVPQGPPFFDYFAGLDLGQVNDWTALSILRRTEVDRDALPHRRWRFSLVHLQRFPRGTSYVQIADEVVRIMGRPELHAMRLVRNRKGEVLVRPAPDPVLVLDGTGVGRACVDLVVSRPMPARLAAVSIHGGATARREPWGTVDRRDNRPRYRGGAATVRTVEVDGHWVGKVELVGVLQSLLQVGMIEFAPSLEHAPTLRDEMRNFQAKLNPSGHETLEHRDGKHDDLVLSVACALWVATRPDEDRGLVRVDLKPGHRPYRG